MIFKIVSTISVVGILLATLGYGTDAGVIGFLIMLVTFALLVLGVIWDIV